MHLAAPSSSKEPRISTPRPATPPDWGGVRSVRARAPGSQPEGASSSARPRTMRPGLVNFASVTGLRVTLIAAFTRTCFRFTGAGSSPGGLLACNLSLLPIRLVLVIYFPRARRPVLKNPIPFRFQPNKGWSIESGALWPAPCLSPGSLRHSLPTLPDHLRQDAGLPDCPPDCHCSACSLLSKDTTSHMSSDCVCLPGASVPL